MVAWQATWYYENIDFSAMPFKMRELSQLIKITSFLSGKELRLKLTNYYGKEELIFDEIYVALTADMKEKQRVTALYQDTIVIPQGEAIWTDSIDLDIKVGQT
ncbi:SGNH/GDSL hydrolase family protein, partial [Lactobacillus salivarius]|nr:SGNH/GDSL hydrolase family protein [Ligilactobacillus salivarius]